MISAFFQPQQLFRNGIQEKDIPFFVQPDNAVPHLIDDRFDAAFFKFDLRQVAVFIFVQFFGHDIESIGQIAELIVLLEIDPLFIVLSGDLLDAFGQGADRIGNDAGQIENKGKGYQREDGKDDRQYILALSAVFCAVAFLRRMAISFRSCI